MKAAAASLAAAPHPDDRITRIRRRYQTEVPRLSIERARYYTESWRATEDQGLPPAIRVAMGMRNVFQKMSIHVDPDDRIAGTWTETFMGLPIYIERGEYNRVFTAELRKADLIAFRGRTLVKGLAYMTRKGALREFLRNQRIARADGTPPLNMSLKTMVEREINPYDIDPADRQELLDDLLPYWEGKCLADRLETELAAAGLYSRDMHDFVTGLPGNTSRQVSWLSTCATLATIQGHVILDYRRVLKKGLVRMQAEVRARLDAADEQAEKDFYRSLDIALDGIIIFARRLTARLAEKLKAERDPERRAILSRMHDHCRRAPLESARSFGEAVQAIWTVKTAVELAHPVNLHCFGRLDQDLYPYYRRDREAGRLEPAAARELLEELLLKIMSQNIRPESNILANFYHRFLGSAPVTLGGVTPRGRDAANELTRLFIQAAQRSRAITNVAVRLHPGTPEEIWHEIAAALVEGSSNLSLFNDLSVIAAMRKRGFAPADARDYAIMGCVEATCPGKTAAMSAHALQLCRLLDITLRNGDSKIMAGTIRGDGPRTGAGDSFQSFDALLDAFFAQARHAIGLIVEGSRLRDRLHAELLPTPCISAFIDGCLEQGRDATQGGGRYRLSGISMINSIANLTDSLLAIKKLVFEQRRCTIRELLAALDDNFAGREDLAAAVENLPGKWGNADPETDALARRVMNELYRETYRHRSIPDGPYVVYLISMITHTVEGRLSPATPDGRRASRPYAASSNPYNVEKAGVTAALRSVAALPNDEVMGAAVNVKFHPSAIGRSRAAREKWIALVRTYFRLGGQQLQPTVADAALLRDAQRHPEHHRDLIVKVGGYSTYFVDLGREIQEEVIARTEHH